jgi:hypothetical protein
VVLRATGGQGMKRIRLQANLFVGNWNFFPGVIWQFLCSRSGARSEDGKTAVADVLCPDW